MVTVPLMGLIGPEAIMSVKDLINGETLWKGPLTELYHLKRKQALRFPSTFNYNFLINCCNV